MDTSSHTMEGLFMQLGLNSSKEAIAEFISTHRVSENEALERASFWSLAQAQFIRECWNNDADWAEIVDQLNSQLRG